MSELKRIGYWRKIENETSDLLWPIEDRGTSEAIKRKVVKYLRSGQIYERWKGWSTCRLCGMENGSTCMTKGGFVYPSGYAHYIEDHDIEIDPDLLAKVLKG